MGKLDRVIRIIAGLALLAFALRLGFPDTGWNWVGWIGLVPLLTALVRVCPAYNILGIRTGR
jgi:hypothetical protein